MKKSVFACATALSAGVLLALAAPMAASAHVTIDPSETAAGTYSVLTFSVGHGCEGSPTRAITIDVPEGINSVTPTVNPGWTIEKVVETLPDGTEDAHGNALTERVSQVVYSTDTPLPDGLRTTFALSLQLAGEAGDVLEFPTTQDCVDGQTVWEGEDVPNVELTTAADVVAHDADEAAEARPEQSATGTSDTIARVIGIGGLAVGAVGIVLAVTARRKVQG